MSSWAYVDDLAPTRRAPTGDDIDARERVVGDVSPSVTASGSD